jgi:hypothetical protein
MYSPGDIIYELNDLITEQLQLRYVDHPEELKQIFDERLMSQLRYDNHVREKKKMIELNKPKGLITYTRLSVIDGGICFIYTDINYNGALFRISPDTIFPEIVNFIYEHQDDNPEQSKYDKKVEEIKNKLAAEYKHEKFQYQIYEDPIRGTPVTRILLYNHMFTIEPDTKWTAITKFIDASKTPQTPGCKSCESENIYGLISCNKCSGMFCRDCYIKIYKKGKGIITCPYCGDKYGIKQSPIQVELGIKQIIHTSNQRMWQQKHNQNKQSHKTELHQHADKYNKLLLPTTVVNIKKIGFMKILYKYIHESNPIVYKVGSDGYDLDDIVGAPIISDTDGTEYKVGLITWCAIGDIYNIIMMRKIFSKQNLLPLKIDFSKDISKWMADLMNKVGFSDKLVEIAKKILIKDIETFQMFTQYYKSSDLREYLMNE